jgi:hypothetical protein
MQDPRVLADYRQRFRPLLVSGHSLFVDIPSALYGFSPVPTLQPMRFGLSLPVLCPTVAVYLPSFAGVLWRQWNNSRNADRVRAFLKVPASHAATFCLGRFRCSGTKPTFEYNSSYWTSGATLNDNASLYAAYVANQTEAVFRPFVNMPGVGVRLVMTANGAYSSRGTGANLDLPLGNFSSLVGLFSQKPTVYSSPQPGLPSEWWANLNWPVPNHYVAYSVPLTASILAWQATVPGTAGAQPNCNLQGVNVGKEILVMLVLCDSVEMRLLKSSRRVIVDSFNAANMYRNGALYQGNSGPSGYSADGGTFASTFAVQFRIG